MNKYLDLLKKQKSPAKFLLGYFLWKSGLCKLFTFKVNGIKFRFYQSGLSMNLFINRDYINEDFNYIKKYLSAGNTFIDIGANIGTWSIFASKVVGNVGKILSFEPHPKTFKYLSGNITLNKSENIEYFNVGCSDKKGNLYFSNNYDTMNHITYNSVDSIIIPVKELDFFTSELKEIDLIKIDVEGFELNVLKGATNTLAKTKMIIFESNKEFQKKYNYRTEDIINFLITHNFKVFKIHENGDYIHLNSKYSSILGEDLIALKS